MCVFMYMQPAILLALINLFMLEAKVIVEHIWSSWLRVMMTGMLRRCKFILSNAALGMTFFLFLLCFFFFFACLCVMFFSVYDSKLCIYVILGIVGLICTCMTILWKGRCIRLQQFSEKKPISVIILLVCILPCNAFIYLCLWKNLLVQVLSSC